MHRRKLDDLESGDPFFPPNSDTTSSKEVVPVHENVNGKVQRDRNPLDSGVANELGVAQQSGSTMVVSVEESQRFSSQHQKHSVEQLQVLGKVVEVVQGDKFVGESTFVTNRPEEAVVVHHWDKLFQKNNKEDK